MHQDRDRNRGIRFILFFLFICVGFGGGWFYSRVINPVEIIDTTPATLRRDYQTDYVLMLAEVYSTYQDPNYVLCQLALLGESDPLETISSALQYGSMLGYTPEDLSLMNDLKQDLNELQLNVEVCY